VTATGSKPLNGENTTEMPMFIREAKQPDGFPSPTPVGKVLVKQYPAYRSATTSKEQGRKNSMFRTLFKHIKNNDIAMTAPVEMTYDENGTEGMGFLYANTDVGTTGQDGAVETVDIPAMSVVAIGVRGDYTKERFEKHRVRLAQWLVENREEWVKAGEPRYFAFNSPFVPGMMKYGEVQIPVRKAKVQGPSAVKSQAR
jgi:hypothetical protein